MSIFGKLSGMGDLAAVMKAAMSGDKSGLVALLRPHLPGILTTSTTAIIKAAGGEPASDGAFLWVQTRNGQLTVMATVYRRSLIGAPVEEVGTIDVLASLKDLDLAQFIE